MPIAGDRTGTELLHYRIEILLGRGGMGEVYRAEDLRLKRRVALKLLPPGLAEDDRFRARFLRESELAASIEHPGIVPIYEAGEVDGQLYLAMRYVAGTDLKKLLRREGALAPVRALGLVGQVADALDAAHERGLVHRDVKPSNILIAQHGGREHCYLADFGLTKKSGSQSGVSVTGDVVGTVDYVAPEQIRGDRVDGRADVYSVGCLVYECLTGEAPFSRPSELATVYAHLEDAPPKVSTRRRELPVAIDGVVEKALAKSPEDRYASGGELVEAARAAVGPPSSPAPQNHLGRRRIALTVAAVVAAAVLAGVGSLVYFLTRDDPVAPGPAPAYAAVIDPQKNTVIEQVPIGPAPTAAAVGEGVVWIANAKNHTISTIDPGSLDEVGRVGVVAGASSLVVGGGYAWAGDIHEPGGLWRINLDLGEVHPVQLPASVGEAGLQLPLLAYGFDSVWVVQSLDTLPNNVIRIRAGQLPVALDVLPKGCLAAGIAAGEGAVWIACQDPRLLRIDPLTNRRSALIRVGSDSSLGGVAVGAGAVWVSDLFEEVVWRIDPKTARPTRTISVPGVSTFMAFGEGALWVINQTVPPSVSRIDPAQHRRIATIRLEHAPRAIAVGEGKIWVTTERVPGAGVSH